MDPDTVGSALFCRIRIGIILPDPDGRYFAGSGSGKINDTAVMKRKKQF
jgi:hypothetical protein